MAKQKKQLTSKQQAKKYNRIANLLFAGEFVSIPTPFVIMGIVNREEWFATNQSGLQIGIGGTIAIALMSLVAVIVALKKENKEITGGYLAIIFAYYLLGAIAWCLESIMHQIKEIIFITGTGLIGAMVLDNQSKKMKKKSNYNLKVANDAQYRKDLDKAIDELNK